MREAIGSSWLVYLAVIFILIYIFFVGFVMNYASAYRAANYVISQIENCNGEITNCDDYSSGDMMTTITSYIKSRYGYLTPNRYPNTSTRINPACKKNGTGIIFSIELPVEIDIPLISSRGLNWATVKAETKTIQKSECP